MIHPQRHSHTSDRLPDGMPPLPDSDEEISHLGDDTPIADIGTAHHPVSTPPTAMSAAPLTAPAALDQPHYLRTGAIAAVLGAALAISLAPFFIDTSARPAARTPSASNGSVRAASQVAPGANGTTAAHEVELSPVRIGAEQTRAHVTLTAAQTTAVARMPPVGQANFAAVPSASATQSLRAASTSSADVGSHPHIVVVK